MQRLLFDTVAARITDSDILSCDWDNSHTATPRSYTMKLPRVRVVQTGTMLGNAAVVQFDPPDFMLKNESSGLHHFDCVPGDCVAWFPFNSSYEVILPREWRRAVASCKLSRADSWGLHGFDCTALRCQVFRNELRWLRFFWGLSFVDYDYPFAVFPNFAYARLVIGAILPCAL